MVHGEEISPPRARLSQVLAVGEPVAAVEFEEFQIERRAIRKLVNLYVDARANHLRCWMVVVECHKETGISAITWIKWNNRGEAIGEEGLGEVVRVGTTTYPRRKQLGSTRALLANDLVDGCRCRCGEHCQNKCRKRDSNSKPAHHLVLPRYHRSSSVGFSDNQRPFVIRLLAPPFIGV
jgi:hypothetical protein